MEHNTADPTAVQDVPSDRPSHPAARLSPRRVRPRRKAPGTAPYRGKVNPRRAC